MVSVIIPAAGQGRRMQAGCNKVFLTLGGEPVLVRTLRQFARVPAVSECIVVAGAQEMETVEAMLRAADAREGLPSWRVVAGGSERQYSVANGLAACDKEAEIVLVHDAARPLIRPAVIAAVIEAARTTGGAIAAVPEKNTVKVVDAAGRVVETPPRSALWAVQTPQGFRRETLAAAYAQAAADGFLGTDDASLVERLGAPVAVVESDYQNIKVTTPEDLVIAEALLKAAQEDR